MEYKNNGDFRVCQWRTDIYTETGADCNGDYVETMDNNTDATYRINLDENGTPKSATYKENITETEGTDELIDTDNDGNADVRKNTEWIGGDVVTKIDNNLDGSFDEKIVETKSAKITYVRGDNGKWVFKEREAY